MNFAKVTAIVAGFAAVAFGLKQMMLIDLMEKVMGFVPVEYQETIRKIIAVLAVYGGGLALMKLKKM